MKSHRNISELLEYKLSEFNKNSPLVQIPNEETATKRISDCYDRFQKAISKVSIEIDNVEFDRDQVKVEIPKAFQKHKPVRYEAIASHYFSDGVLAGQNKFGVDVIM